ncbi:uncharacterized protein G2W53_044042 [Senna tora]|uniref:Uncharacterized protein n=1 Tax=Senna tora TaxID=362788 RepID=A0A834SJV7_9FABA|nr:uncharacterized protein G2W53_044042 [Senna tora]
MSPPINQSHNSSPSDAAAVDPLVIEVCKLKTARTKGFALKQRSERALNQQHFGTAEVMLSAVISDQQTCSVRLLEKTLEKLRESSSPTFLSRNPYRNGMQHSIKHKSFVLPEEIIRSGALSRGESDVGGNNRKQSSVSPSSRRFVAVHSQGKALRSSGDLNSLGDDDFRRWQWRWLNFNGHEEGRSRKEKKVEAAESRGLPLLCFV